MFNSLTKAYKGGWRAGMAEPQCTIINGLSYMMHPHCPYYKLRHALHIVVWQQGLYNGTVERLGGLTRSARRKGYRA